MQLLLLLLYGLLTASSGDVNGTAVMIHACWWLGVCVLPRKGRLLCL